MRWLLAWLVFNALVVAWRLLVTLSNFRTARDERVRAMIGSS